MPPVAVPRRSCTTPSAADSVAAGARELDGVRYTLVTVDGDASHAGDTSYLAVIDKDRNMVSFEPRLPSTHSMVASR